MRPTLVTRGSRLILKTGPFDSFTSCSLGFRVSAWTTIERNLSIRNDWPPLPSLEGARHNYRTGRVVTQASASASTLSGRLERLRESLAVMGMDCEDPKADVVESRGSRGELFDPDDLRRTRDARLIRQEDFDFQPRTHLRLLIRVDAQTAETRIDPPASAEKAQDRPREIYGDRKSTRLNSSHLVISYAVFCLKKKKDKDTLHKLAVMPPQAGKNRTTT